jgi:hypothetical protein
MTSDGFSLQLEEALVGNATSAILLQIRNSSNELFSECSIIARKTGIQVLDSTPIMVPDKNYDDVAST